MSPFRPRTDATGDVYILERQGAASNMHTTLKQLKAPRLPSSLCQTGRCNVEWGISVTLDSVLANSRDAVDVKE